MKIDLLMISASRLDKLEFRLAHTLLQKNPKLLKATQRMLKKEKAWYRYLLLREFNLHRGASK
jgi:hypothetical protein